MPTFCINIVIFIHLFPNNCDVDPIARLETFRALKLSRLNHFKALKPKDPKEVFSQRVVIRRKSLQQAYYSSTFVHTLYTANNFWSNSTKLIFAWFTSTREETLKRNLINLKQVCQALHSVYLIGKKKIYGGNETGRI